MEILHITKDNFESEVLASPVPVLLDFFATWCGPCRALAPVLQQVADEVVGIRVAKVDVDEAPDLAQKFGIMTVPTLVVIKDGAEVRRASGVRPKAALIALVFGE